MDATVFSGSLSYKKDQLMSLLSSCVDIYEEILSQNIQLKNNEEFIRDAIFDFLNNDEYRSNVGVLQLFHFEKEPQENSGFLDIKVKPLNPYESTKAYYVIECKRLNAHNLTGTTGMNAEYVKNGICRFVTNYYSSYFDSNMMFGFLTEKADIHLDIVSNINEMLNVDYTNARGEKVNANASQPLMYEEIRRGYPYSYVSKHTRNNGKNVDLYHLFFDFSSVVI